MKKTVNLTSLLKAKSDLELFIRIDQLKRLKKLFDPTFDIRDLNSKIESKEDQLIVIKEAIDKGNSNLDKEGHTVSYSIYRLSKHNRFKSDLLGLQRRFENDEFIRGTEDTKTSLLNDIKELDTLVEKETDKKIKAEHVVAKNKLKRSLSKVSTNNKSHTDKMMKIVDEDLKINEETINSIKAHLTELNNSINVEVDVADEFEIVVK